MIGKNGLKIISMALAVSLALPTSSMIREARAEETVTGRTSSYDAQTVQRLNSNYTSVSAAYTAGEYRGARLVAPVSEAVASDPALKAADPAGYGSDVADVTPGDKVTLHISVPEKALYAVGFDYYSYDASILPIELGFKVDGDYPFYECRSLRFETSWVSSGNVSYDRYGNEIVSLPEKRMTWEHKALCDGSYRYSTPLLVELEKGEHELEVTVNEGKLYLGNVTLEPVEHIKAHTPGEAAAGESLIIIEGENFFERNDSSIHATGEYDADLYPLNTSLTVLNTVDQDSFNTAGQKISYSFDVEKTGWYKIGMNCRQSEKNGFPVFVNFFLDEEIKDEAFLNYPIQYSSGYELIDLEADEGAMSVYLEAGTHTFGMQISADYLRYALEEADAVMNAVNDLSLEVTKVAGTNKDRYRDLKLTRYIPDVQDRLYSWVDRLYAIANDACRYVDTDDPEDIAAFAYLIIAAKQLKTLAEEPDELVYRVDELSTSVNSINTQIANFIDLINRNDLSIDRIYFYQDDAKLPKGPGFFERIWLGILRFINSFFGQSYSSSNVDEEHIQVWVNRPRQYLEIMQKMIDDKFTPQTGIYVDLSLMTDANKLVLSNASGDTPDIATGINYSIPFELGIRGALVDLTKFDNYREVFGRYSEGLLVPSVIGETLISLPETMNFYVMFCRTDILEKMGLSAPDTIDELVAMLPDLQMRGLNVYYPTAAMLAMRNFHGTTPLVFQNGGSLYGKDPLDILVGSEETVRGFTQLTELFTIYDLPVDVPNFYQHFRNGDLCIGIADFNSYNLIKNAAPEIANSWSIYPVPGVMDEDTKEIARYMSGGAESTVMFASNDEREQQAWKFMDWWSTADVQAEFGQLLQIMYGDEYIWPTANLEAFDMLPFSTSDRQIIREQAQSILEAPRLLGSYMMERELSNAFNDIVVNGETLRSRLDEAVKIVNSETVRKLTEFGYLDENGQMIKEYPIPNVEKVREILR
ncbi:MAG: extracellular solute-binding protein [Lachnospiraceae bacterium]|nr:extracellular solute-binding protein [Lachnospiraceae bacterium]